MNDLYVTDEKGRNIYHVYNVKTPYGTVIRTIKYDFGAKNYGIAFVARDCLDTLGYKYNDGRPNDAIYKFVSKENIINGKNDTPHNACGVSNNVYIKTEYHDQIKPVVFVTQNGFFELVGRSSMPDAKKFQHWVYNEVIPAVYDGENASINRYDNGGTFELLDYIHEEVGSPSIRGTRADQIKELISNYARLTRRTYQMAFQEFEKAFWKLYHKDISKLKGKGPMYQRIVDNGLYDQAKYVLNKLISQCSSANTGYVSENMAEALSQLSNTINDLNYSYNICMNLINSDPNYTMTNGIPRKRVVKRLTDKQIDTINDYANKYGVDTVEAIHELFD